MLADKYKLWSREGGSFDIIAIAAALVVTFGGLFFFNPSSSEYRASSRATIVSALPVVPPMSVPGTALSQ